MNRKDNNEILNCKAVYHDKVYLTQELKSATIKQIFDKIRASEILKEHTKVLRTLQSEDEQREYKKNNLPYFNLGEFRDNHRLDTKLIASSFFIFDYDHLDDKLGELKSRFRADASVFAYFISPRGNGLKVIYRLDNEITDHEHFSRLYKHYATEFKIDLGKESDKTSDASRACFFSYDPDLYFNPDAESLKTDVVSLLPVNSTISKKLELTNTIFDSVLVKRAIELLRLQKLGYNDWLACGFALAPLGELGRQFFQLLSNGPNYTDSSKEIDQKFKNLVDNPEKHNDIETLYLVAAKYGFEIMSLAKQASPVSPISFDKELEDQFLLDDTRDPNKLLGFPLTRFKELAGHVDGLQPGFYLLGAESNIGKTAVLTNMALDVLDTNPDVSVMYFSLDDSRKYTAYRFLSIMTQLSINDTHKQQTDPSKAAILKDGRAKLIDLARSKRLLVKDTSEVCTADQLKAEIQAFADKSKLVVFIDGLYNLEVGDNIGAIREANIERARLVKQLVDIYRIPVLTTGELRKKTKEEGKDKAPTVHDLMETGKFAYNANVVWLLYGKTEDLKSDEPTLTLEYVKNKLSDYKGFQHLSFTRATGTMSEALCFLTQRPTKPLFTDGGGLE
jgi:hypothetical protein